MRTQRLTTIAVLALAVAAAAWFGYSTGLRLNASPSIVLDELVPDGGGMRAGGSGADAWLDIPAAEAEFETLDGGTVRLADYRGGIVLLNFWGTWCAPCVYEIPELVSLQPRLEALGGTIIGPAIDSGSPDKIRAFLADYDVNYPVVITTGSVAVGDFGAPGYPATLLIDAEGVIRRIYLGPQTADVLLADVERWLSEGGSGT